MTPRVIDIGRDFTRYPAGRFNDDGPYSGQAFRERFLVPALAANERTIVSLDGTAGYGSSFLEEAFGGLVRLGHSADAILKTFELQTNDESLKTEIVEYIRNAVP